MISRREALRAAAAASGAPAGPYFHLGRYRLFAGAPAEYSARSLKLLQDVTVVDMLSPLTIDDRWSERSKNPETFTESVFQRYRESGIQGELRLPRENRHRGPGSSQAGVRSHRRPDSAALFGWGDRRHPGRNFARVLAGIWPAQKGS